MKKVFSCIFTLILILILMMSISMVASAEVLSGWKDYGKDVFDQFNKTTMVSNTNGSITFNNEKKKGGFCVADTVDVYNFQNFTMEFTINASTVANLSSGWIGFSLSNDKNSWYDSNFGVLVLARPTAKETAKMSPIPLLGGSFQEIQINEVLPFYIDGKVNSFSMVKTNGKYILIINGKQMLYNDVETDYDTPFQTKMNTIATEMGNNNVYLQLVSSYTEAEGEVSITINKINGNVPVKNTTSSISSISSQQSVSTSTPISTSSSISNISTVPNSSKLTSSLVSSEVVSNDSSSPSMDSSSNISSIIKQLNSSDTSSKDGTKAEFPFVAVIIVIVVILAAGGASYYFLVLKRKL